MLLNLNNKIIPLLGSIDVLHNGEVLGWLAADSEVFPVLLIDGKYVELLEWPISRPDVKDSLGAFKNSGFRFLAPYLRKESTIELFALHQGQIKKVCSKKLYQEQYCINTLEQIKKAKALSLQKKSIAIVCWDGAHNPIGRAKTLYDITKTNRPSILFSYIFNDFGHELWAPLKDQDIDIVLIPWISRSYFHNMIQKMGISFNTVWLCKPRFPTFVLGSLISKPDSKLILDIDDNEDAFLSLKTANKPYGLITKGLTDTIVNNIKSKTVSNCNLQKKYGGEIIRHARKGQYFSQYPKQNLNTIKVLFLGTVRPHKNILSAAKSLVIFKQITGIEIEFHVYGDIRPESEKVDLENSGVILKDIVPSKELFDVISSADIVLGGYPSLNCEDEEITNFQITAKIGDALSCNRPILVPRAKSLEDLIDIPGIYQFDQNDFYDVLLYAINSDRENVSLPAQFTHEYSYQKFIAIEKKTPKNSLALKIPENIYLKKPCTEKSIVLLWKQNDAGLYGRRIDQIARAYKSRYPERNVCILEFMHENTRKELNKNQLNWLSDSELKLEFSIKKSNGNYIDQGIIYSEIFFNSSANLNNEFFFFLSENGYTPENTVIIAFPIIQFFEKIIPTIQAYPVIIDIVDNQLSWNSGSKKIEALKKYAAAFSISNHIIFNSMVTLDYFKSIYSQISTLDNWHFIPNFYIPPSKIFPPTNNPKKTKGFVYSGNLNDRIDWQLLGEVADQFPDYYIRIIGSAERETKNLSELIKRQNVIYYGPLTEEATIAVANESEIALVPHVKNEISNYMNPLKIMMYESLGLPIICTEIEGLDEENTNIFICKNNGQFITSIREILQDKLKLNSPRNTGNSSNNYLKIIDSLID